MVGRPQDSNCVFVIAGWAILTNAYLVNYDLDQTRSVWNKVGPNASK